MKSFLLLTLFTLIMCCQMEALAKPNPKDYKKWLGPQSCAECHEMETAIWRNSHHGKSFKTMARKEKGRAIAKKMKVKRIKTSDDCITCHYTFKLKSATRVRAIAGPSCESCHGPAKEWNDIHYDYGGRNVTAKQESQAHKVLRWKKSKKAGMIRPKDLYGSFKQCMTCHTINNEKLVNVGGHPTGDKFELVAWSNGEIRHNVWYNNGKANALDSRSRQRMKYVVGQALKVEYALRALAKSTKAGPYTKALQSRVKGAVKQLKLINQHAKSKPLQDILTTLKPLALTEGHGEAQLLAADEVRKSTKEFIQQTQGKQLTAIDPLLPKKYHGKPKS